MKTRILHTKVWNDNFFIDLSIVEKLLFVYLLTNENMNILHIYECPDRVITFQTGVTPQQLQAAKKKFQQAGKILFHQGYVYVKNADKYEDYNSEKYDKAKETIKRHIGEDIVNHFLTDTVASDDPYDTSVIPVEERSDTGVTPDINHKTEIINHKSEKGDVKGETGLAEKNHSSLDDISSGDFEEIAEKYHVPLSFVLSKFEDMASWAGQPRNKSKVKGRNWRLTLMSWVKRDALERREHAASNSSIAYVGEPVT